MKEIGIGTRIKLHSYSDFAKVKSSDGKWTLYKDKKNLSTIHNYTYDDIEAFDSCEEYFKVRIGNSWGIIGQNGYLCYQEIIHCLYDKIEIFMSDFFIVHVTMPSNNISSYMGIFNKQGLKIYEPNLIDITIIEEGERLYCFVKNNKNEKSFIDLRDEYVAYWNPKFYHDIIKEEHGDTTIYQVVVKKEDNSKTFGYIGKRGEIIVPPIFNYISYLGDSFYAYRTKHASTGVIKSNDYGGLNKYEDYIKCEELLYGEKQQLNCNSIHLYKSMMFISPIYKYISYKNNFFRAVLETGEIDIYDNEGKMLIHFSEGQVFSKNMQKLVSENLYSKNNIYIKFNLNNKKGLISKFGVIIIPPLYDDIEILKETQHDDFFKVKCNNKYTIYKNGEKLSGICGFYDEIFTDTFDFINTQINGFVVRNKDLYGVVSYNGDIIYPHYKSLRCNNKSEFIVETDGKYRAIALTTNVWTKLYDSMEFHCGEIYGRAGRMFDVLYNLETIKSSFLIEDLSQGYFDLNQFITDCKNINLLTKDSNE